MVCKRVIWTVMSNVQRHTWLSMDESPKVTQRNEALKSGETECLLFSCRIFLQPTNIRIIPCLVVPCYFEIYAHYIRECISVMKLLSLMFSFAGPSGRAA